MAVDIKSLRIGSHVEYNGKRAMVYDMSAKMNTPDYLVMIYQDGRFTMVPLDELSPIVITDELLKELGFKYRKSAGGSWCISDKKGGYFYAIVISDSTCIVTHHPNFGFQSRVVCANLHELEAFAYFIAKTELIKE